MRTISKPRVDTISGTSVLTALMAGAKLPFGSFGSGGGRACEMQLSTFQSLSIAAISMREHVPTLRLASTFRLKESALHFRKLQFDFRVHVYGSDMRV